MGNLRILMLLLLAAGLAKGQSSHDLERRVIELEQKMRQLDASFQPADPTAGLAARLDALEKRLNAALEAKSVQPAPEPAPSSPIEAMSITGDFKTAEGGETRLPVAGYMDFHFNKEKGDSFRPDFHRFVLLFGHSFSDRIKFWSELEIEHALVEGGEETGEVAVEQAYLDFLGKPYLNFRAGMVLTPVVIVNERHEPPSFNGVERPFVETFIIPTTWRELGFGLTGDVGRGFRYRTYLTSSLDASRFNAEFGIKRRPHLGV